MGAAVSGTIAAVTDGQQTIAATTAAAADPAPPDSILSSEGTPRFLTPLFWLARFAPSAGRWLCRPAAAVALAASPSLRRHTRENAIGIFGSGVAAGRIAEYQRAVVSSFFDFIMDIGDARRMSNDALDARIESTQGVDAYADARKKSRGVILLTGHMGSFEVGLARLVRMEPRVQVVYKNDALIAFEALRRAVRDRLGVREAPIDQGLGTWIRLRDALNRGEAIVMQGDRAMPGQPAHEVPLLHGTIRLPIGAYKLARMTGSCVVPVFTVRVAPRTFRIVLFPAITGLDAACVPGKSDPGVCAFADALASMIETYPDQWLVLKPAFSSLAAPSIRTTLPTETGT